MAEDLKVLVQELSKVHPNVDLVKNKTATLGIPYSPDQIILMSEVLVYLSKNPATHQARKKPLKEKAL
jgi:hypothetical protein